MKAAYPGRVREFRRVVSLLERRRIAIEDTIAAAAPVDALWGMMTAAQVSLNGARAELSERGARLAARIVSPEGARFDVAAASAEPPQNPNAGFRRLVVRLPGRVENVKIAVELEPR